MWGSSRMRRTRTETGTTAQIQPWAGHPQHGVLEGFLHFNFIFGLLAGYNITKKFTDKP
jgi:hypothetical protein